MVQVQRKGQAAAQHPAKDINPKDTLLITPLGPSLALTQGQPHPTRSAVQRPSELPQTVLRHFPADPDGVQRLAQTDPDFRDMCDELDAAETAFDRIETLPAAVRAARREECQGWIERLTTEMERALADAKVVPLTRPGPGARP